MIKKLITIARYLTTRYESKKHGGYDIYEDEKIKISYDTFFPNVEVHINDGGKWVLVLLHNGGGFDQVNHPGKWEKYVTDVLFPKAEKAKKLKLEKQKREKEIEHNNKYGAIDDSHIFNF